MKSKIKKFKDLTVNELYDILKLRTDVFVVEQDCPYPELDGKDKLADHFLGIIDDGIVATARILPENISYPELSIGRVVVDHNYRNGSIGRDMMVFILEFMDKEWPAKNIKISAQSHLRKFYERLGFKPTGKKYLEDGIPHIEMILIK